MKISLEKLTAQAASTGLRPEVLEKVAHLLGFFDALRSHPFLKGKLALKGGTPIRVHPVQLQTFYTPCLLCK
jgi:hypothetical protein